MARLSRQTKEIIKTVLFVLTIAILVTAYIIYPLNRTKVIMGRADIDDHNPDSLAVNDPTSYVEKGLPADTFRFEADGLTNLACLYIAADSGSESTYGPPGTVILMHDDNATRDSLFELAAQLHEAGFVVVAYDQRASGLTTGKYRGEGHLEGTDVQALVSHLEIREQIVHPLYLVGYGLGGEAALLASLEEERIDGVVAVRPYFTTKRMQDVLRARYDTYWFPFYRTITWWWYGIRSGYGAPYRRIDDIRPVRCRTLVYANVDAHEETERLRELSPADLLQIKQIPVGKRAVYDGTVAFLTALPDHR